MKMFGKNIGIFLLFTAILTVSVERSDAETSKNTNTATAKSEKKTVTFIELGSVNCVPCKAMQPIMEKVRKELGDQVEVVFYDVWTEAGKPYGGKYRIRVIPTQVFLDRDGKEYYRHEGFFPEAELKKILAQGGVKI
ncbi:MAG: thioredoxin family protein [Treponemataceae bacterium]